MRLLHTSDWHLGRTLHGYSLREAQERAVDAIVSLAIEQSVDLVVVAGDVFDRAVPPVDALRLLNRALARLDVAGVTTLVTSGNHDSGERLATYAGLLRDSVRIVGSTADVAVPVELVDEHGPVLIYPVPYLEPDFARHDLAGGEDPLARSHEAVMSAALDLIGADLAKRGRPRAVAVGHAFVADIRSSAEEMASSSERDLTVGGVQVVPVDVFRDLGLDYVAMGHLHRPQAVNAASPVVRYSGSLLRYSLSEAGHRKSVVLVELGAPGTPPVITLADLPEDRGMARLRGSMDELTGALGEPHRDDYVELVVTDAAYPERMHARLDAIFPFALAKLHQPEGVDFADVAHRGDARGRDPLDVVGSFFRKVTGRELSESQQGVLRAAYDAARQDG